MTRKTMITYGYRAVVFILLLTGFAQMPIFKRYYIADLPGLGWLAQYYVTHLIHMILAIVFVLWIVYAGTWHLIENRGHIRDRFGAIVKSVLIGGIVLTGFLLVMRNFPGYRFSQGTIIALDVAHLAFSLIYLAAAYLLTFRKPG